MNVRNLLADAFDSAAIRLRNNSCGMSDKEMEAALHKMLYLLDNDHHFSEADARAAIARMYYFRDDTHKSYAPFFPYEDIRAAYDKMYLTLPDDYNFWDFCVTVNLMYSNHIETLRSWFRDRSRLLQKSCELARSFLLDEDTDHPSDKIWWYVNS